MKAIDDEALAPRPTSTRQEIERLGLKHAIVAAALAAERRGGWSREDMLAECVIRLCSYCESLEQRLLNAADERVELYRRLSDPRIGEEFEPRMEHG